jgi:hypothetical protein
LIRHRTKFDCQYSDSLNSPRTGIIGTTSNKLTYRLFTEPRWRVITCGATTPPPINQQWTAVSGVTAVSGIIEVTTTTNGPTAQAYYRA